VAGEQTPDPGNFRRYLYGDLPLDEWPPDPRDDNLRDGEPWKSFIQARRAAQSEHMKDAVGIWQSIAARHDGEARHVLQAWHFLRQAGTQPGPDIASRVLGTVAEVAVPAGHDVLACYRDGSARYLNFSGSVIVYEGGSAQVDVARRAHSLRDAHPSRAPLRPGPGCSNAHRPRSGRAAVSSDRSADSTR